MEPEQEPAVEHRADGLAERWGLSAEPLVDTGLPRGPGDGVGPRYDDKVPTGASHLLKYLPGQAVLREDNESDAPLLALAEDRLDLEQELFAMDVGNTSAQLAETSVQLGWGLAVWAQGVRESQLEERIFEGRPPWDRDGRQAGDLGDGDASIGARGHK
ncbi:hypothetical protein [Melittangium boletus]|uniref:hypothetical protein n=1 Tax=Melittangium boletus TaxID=83453 RepID=UPI001474A179|nr:hypothetical protein [Melittangium boletus]